MDTKKSRSDSGAFLTSILQHRAIIVSLAIILAGLVLLYLSKNASLGVAADFFGLLGTILVPAALVSFLYEFFLRRTLAAEMREQLAESIREEFSLLGEVDAAGLQHIYRAFPTDQVYRAFESAEERVRVFANWFPNAIQLEKMIAAAVRNGCQAEIILLNPESPQSRSRSRDLGFQSLDTVSNEIRSSLIELHRFLISEGITRGVSIRLHHTTPTHILFAWDDTILLGTYLVGVHALQGPFLQFSISDSSIGSVFMLNFDRIWEKATPYDL